MSEKLNRPYVIGITGTIGSGKSTVGKILEEAGIPVLDTDKIVHDLLTDDTPVRKAVIELFGSSIVQGKPPAGTHGPIDRKELGKRVFVDEPSRKQLEAIIHPAVILECRRRAQALFPRPVVAILAPLIFEAKVEKEYDEVWAVITRPEILKARLRQRDSISETEADERLSAQYPQEKKAALSSVVIDNSGTIEDTRRQVNLHLDKLRAGLRSTQPQ